MRNRVSYVPLNPKGLFETEQKMSFYKNLLFDKKSIRNEKGTVKEKNRAKGNGTEGVFW
jgi:hypothetical protein